MRSADVAELVSRHPLLAGLPGDAASTVAGCARNEAFAAGSLLLSEGEAADTLYLIRRGTVAVEIHGPGRGRIVIETLGPGQAAGWSWLFPPYRWHFDVRAADAVGAVAVDAACLRAKAEQDPALGYELMKRCGAVLLDRLQATRVRLLDLYGDGRPR
ncbi:MAG TPA: cyclic nucleotide-binding domain-containing protein [Acidimicrobiales bacterium]|nr:cyclic nucleotide-binding domain-containing protein [Acidimicrobiales bacterium]